MHTTSRVEETSWLTQAELADRLGERQNFGSVYETGRRRLEVLELRQIAVAIGGSPAGAVVVSLDALDADMTAVGEPRRDAATGRVR